jgi:hypothetical protein
MWLGVPEEVDECLGNPEEGKNGEKCVRRPRKSRGKFRNSPPMPMMTVHHKTESEWQHSDDFFPKSNERSSLKLFI